MVDVLPGPSGQWGILVEKYLPNGAKRSSQPKRTQSRKRVHFSNEQKQEAVIALCSRTGSAKELAKAQGVTRTVLYNWKNALLGKEAPMAQKKPKDLPKDKDQLLSEIAVLEKQVANA